MPTVDRQNPHDRLTIAIREARYDAACRQANANGQGDDPERDAQVREGFAQWRAETDMRIAAFLEPDAWHPLSGRPDMRLSLSANNLFDVEARRHASFLKDFAPMAGRDIRLSLRMTL